MCRVRGGSRIGLLQKAANSLQEAENRRKSFCLGVFVGAGKKTKLPMG